MYALSVVAIGLIVAHALALVAYAIGSAALYTPAARDRRSAGRCALRVVLATFTGIAILVFEGIVLGFAHLYTPAGVALLACTNAALLALRVRSSGVAPFFNGCFDEVRTSMRGPGFVIYCAMLVLCVPAALPEFSSDALRVHLAYAFDWVRAGGLYVDHRFRFPYYTFNDEVLDALIFCVGAGRYIGFVTWLAGTLSALGIYGLIETIDESARPQRGAVSTGAIRLVAIICALSAVTSATFLRWNDTAMPDVLSGALLLATVAGLVLAAMGDERRGLFGASITAAFLCGMKPSYLFFVPLVACALLAAAASTRQRWSAVALLLVLTAPWYLRNAIAVGDPIPPVGHFALQREDSDFTKAEWSAILADLAPNRSAQSVETYPWRLFVETNTVEFREYGMNALVLWIYPIVLIFPFALMRLKQTPAQRSAAVVFAAVAAGVAYLFATSVLARYTLLVVPLIASGAGIVLSLAIARIRAFVLVAPVLAACSLLVTPGSADFYTRFQSLNYDQLFAILPNDRHALELLAAGYAEAEPIFDARWVGASHDNVLLLVCDLQYYTELAGAQPYGDWGGQGRFADFISAVDAHSIPAYLAQRHIGAVVINRSSRLLVPPEYELMRRELRAAGFLEARSDQYFASFLRAQR